MWTPFPCVLGVVLVVSDIISGNAEDIKRCPEFVYHNTRHYLSTFRDKCYMYVGTEKYWDDARRYCRDMDGDLATAPNHSVMSHLKGQLNSNELGWKKRRKNGVWLGAYYLEHQKFWVWTSGQRLRYSYWASGQPSVTIFGSFEDCACMRRTDDWKWHDYPCSRPLYHYYFICEFPLRPVTTTRPPPTTTTTKKTTTTEQRKTSKSSLARVHLTYDPHGIVLVSNETSSEMAENLQMGSYRHEAVAGASQTDLQKGGHDDEEEKEPEGLLVAIILGGVALLVIIVAFAFFMYRRKRRSKLEAAYDDEPPRFENLSYAALRQAEIEATDPDNCYSPPSYMTSNEINDRLEECRKNPVDHGYNDMYMTPIADPDDADQGACCAELMKKSNLEREYETIPDGNDYVNSAKVNNSDIPEKNVNNENVYEVMPCDIAMATDNSAETAVKPTPSVSGNARLEASGGASCLDDEGYEAPVTTTMVRAVDNEYVDADNAVVNKTYEPELSEQLTEVNEEVHSGIQDGDALITSTNENIYEDLY